MGTTIVHWGYIGTLEQKMETTVVHWGYIGIMENNFNSRLYCAFASDFRLNAGSFLHYVLGHPM